MSFNWSNAAEVAIVTGLGEIPVVGSILGGLVEIFWPESPVDVWAEIKSKVEALVGQAISTNNYDIVQEQLGGLSDLVNNYLDSVKNDEDAHDNWDSANAQFIVTRKSCQGIDVGDEILLLPLFAQMANMHLSLLRDGILKGYCDEDAFNDALNEYTGWVDLTLPKGVSQRAQTNPNSFNYQNDFARFMQLNVGNSRALWPYFDPIAYPPPVKNLPVSAEVFYTITEAVGPSFSSDDYVLPSSPPVGSVTAVNVFCLQNSSENYNVVEGAQVNYTSGSAPYYGVLVNGAPPPNGGTNPTNSYYSYYTQTIGVNPGDPVAKIQGQYDTGGGTYGISLVTKSGAASPITPAQASQSYVAAFTITSPEGYSLSSIWAPAKWSWYNAVRDMVFGFRMDPSNLG